MIVVITMSYLLCHRDVFSTQQESGNRNQTVSLEHRRRLQLYLDQGDYPDAMCSALVEDARNHRREIQEGTCTGLSWEKNKVLRIQQ